MTSKARILFITAAVVVFTVGLSTASPAAGPFHSKGELAQAMAVQMRYEKDLMALPGVHGVGVGERDGRLGILLLVDDRHGEPQMLRQMLPALGGIPVIVRETERFQAHQMNLGTSIGNPILCSGPVNGGTGNFCTVGTSGYKVCDTTAVNTGGFISNNHVAVSGCPGHCPNNAPLGTNLLAPSPVDHPTSPCSTAGLANVGTLNRFVALTLDGATVNNVDAAFVQGTDAQVSDNIQGLGLQSNAVVGAFLGQAVCKSGRTSLVTCGTVTGIGLTVNVNYSMVGQPTSPGLCGTGAGVFQNQIMYSPTAPDTTMSLGGDSGAPVVDAANNAVALNFAGNDVDGVGNPMGTVLTQLNVALCSDIPEPPTADANGPYSAECDGATTAVQLNGTGSSDPDPGDTLSYSWTTDCPGGSFDDATSPTPTLTANTSAQCAVECTAEVTVTDTTGNSDSDTAAVTIYDTTAPDITCPADVTIECDQSSLPAYTGSATATDICDPTLDITSADAVTPGACPEESTILRTWTATDSCGISTTCDQTIGVVDTAPPQISCNAPATIIPPDAPISFTATTTDNCGDSSAQIVGFDCFFFTKKGKRIDKTNSCVVQVSGDTITILDSGGVRDHITWNVHASDSCGNTSDFQCEVLVVRPGH
jgi:hypothetical protein